MLAQRRTTDQSAAWMLQGSRMSAVRLHGVVLEVIRILAL
jgi:hypothetical protein